MGACVRRISVGSGPCVCQESAPVWKLLVSLAFRPLESSLAVVWVRLDLLISKLSLFGLLGVHLLSRSTFLALVGSWSLGRRACVPRCGVGGRQDSEWSRGSSALPETDREITEGVRWSPHPLPGTGLPILL